MKIPNIIWNEDGLAELFFCREKHKISTELDGEAIILDLTSGVYHGLNSIGCFIWNLVEQPKQFKDIRKALMNEYEVSMEQCTRELVEFLKILSENGQIRVNQNKDC